MEFWRHRRQRDEVSIRDAGEIAGPPDHRDAFAEGIRQGRKEERKRHHGHPILKLLVVLVALAGAAVLALAAREGSFSRGGQVVDQNLSSAAGQAQSSAAAVAAQTGEAIKDAGTTIQQKASDATGQNK